MVESTSLFRSTNKDEFRDNIREHIMRYVITSKNTVVVKYGEGCCLQSNNVVWQTETNHFKCTRFPCARN